MKIIATTKIACPASPKGRHTVSLLADGSCACDCPDGTERGESLSARMLLGAPSPEGARGCGALVALIHGSEALLPIVRGSAETSFGPWSELMYAYSKNPVFIASMDRAEKAQPERVEIRQLLVTLIEQAKYRHAMGKRVFRESLKTVWDAPVNDEMDKFVVAAFDDDVWTVPYMPGWKSQISDKNLGMIDGKLVVGRSASDDKLFFAVVPHENGQAHWVRAHHLVGKKLVEVSK